MTQRNINYDTEEALERTKTIYMKQILKINKINKRDTDVI